MGLICSLLPMGHLVQVAPPPQYPLRPLSSLPHLTSLASICTGMSHTPSLIIHVPNAAGHDELHRISRIYTQPNRPSHLTLCLTCHRAHCAVCGEGIAGFWWHHLFCDRVASQESHAWRTSTATYIVTRLDLAQIPPPLVDPPVATQPGPLALGHRSVSSLRRRDSTDLITTTIKADLLERIPPPTALKNGVLSSSYPGAAAGAGGGPLSGGLSPRKGRRPPRLPTSDAAEIHGAIGMDGRPFTSVGAILDRGTPHLHL